MKKLIVTAVLLIGLSSFAQEATKKPSRENLEQLTPQQKTELRLKKMTLDLGLNTAQQKEMGKIIAEMEEKREVFKTERLARGEAGVKPTSEERFAMRTKLLDEQIATKARVKKILDPDQFEKWEKMHEKRMEQFRKEAKRKMARGTAEK